MRYNQMYFLNCNYIIKISFKVNFGGRNHIFIYNVKEFYELILI